jgi:hypothetical protein
MSKAIPEFYRPENTLQNKTGVGGLDPIVIERAQSMGNAIEFDFKPFAMEKIKGMKEQLNSDSFSSANNDNAIDDFLFYLVPFDVNAKLSKNQPLSMISGHLLKFVETLRNFNVDSHHVIKAHVNALDVATTNNLGNPNDPVLNTLMKELKAVCERYHGKHGQK